MRDFDQWKKEIEQDVSILRFHLSRRVLEELLDPEERIKSFAMALKETRRLESDIYRLANDVYEISRQEIDAVGPL